MALSGVCEEKFNEYVRSVDEKINGSIDVLLKIIEAIKAIGKDPTNYAVEGKGAVNFVQTLEAFRTKRNEIVEAARQQFEEKCQPYQDVAKAQAVFNVVQAIATGGLSLVFKDQLKVDLKEIIKDGKIFGGDNSVVNELRAAILGEVIQGDLRKVIEDPGKAAAGALKDVADELKKLAGDIAKIVPQIPPLKFPDIEIKVPEIKVPEIKIPPIKVDLPFKL